MTTLPRRETSRLRFGRETAQGAYYFLTLCTKGRMPILTDEATARTITDSFVSLHSAGDIELLAATIMPDHVHFLFSLGGPLRVGQVIGKFKAFSRNMGLAPWRWQQDGFEHQVRDLESLEDYGFYIFMNPYRSGLCSLATPWSWWLCPQPAIFRFLAGLQQTQGVPEAWLGLSDQIGRRIITGE